VIFTLTGKEFTSRFFKISVEMLTFTGDKITGRQKIATDGRLRNIMQGPDGYIYLGVEGKNSKNNQTKMIFSKQLSR
jgi:hypothetical protein